MRGESSHKAASEGKSSSVRARLVGGVKVDRTAVDYDYETHEASNKTRPRTRTQLSETETKIAEAKTGYGTAESVNFFGLFVDCR